MVEMTTYAPGTPNWIDISTPDMEATKDFYRSLFGWEAISYPEMGGYTNFLLNGKMVCGAALMMSPDQHPAWSTYVAVSDADATAQAVQDNGGQVAYSPMDIANLGRMGVFIDPTGAFFSIWQPGEHKGAQIVNEPGTVGWNELGTRDMAAAKAFYTKVFPWSAVTNGEGEQAYTEWQLDGRSIAGGMQMGASVPPEVPAKWMPYFVVANTDATVATATAGGGALLTPAMDSPQGRFAILADPHGAIFAVIQMQ